MKKLKIESITTNGKVQVYDLSVTDNHNFHISESQILTHNCDFLSPNSQAILRGVMEQYHASARFILTANYPHKILPALHSRCQGFHIDNLDKTEFTARVAEILITEEVNIDINILDSYVKATYPDLRKCIGTCQQNTKDGELIVAKSVSGTKDYKVEVVELFKKKQFNKARQLLCSSVSADSMEEVISWSYNNLDLWSSDAETQDKAILIIRDAAVNASFVASHEINLSAMLIELANLVQE